MTWSEHTLGEVLEFYDHIRVPLSSMERATRPGPYRYYGAQSVIDHIDDYLFDGEYILIAEDGANLVTRNEPIAFLVDGQFWVNNHAHIVRGKEHIADNHFVTSWLNNANIAGFVTGAAQPKLSQQNLKHVKIQLPPYSVQCRITGILSAYDDVIENNRRRMALLEESAWLLYQEWFVRLRFPGHEHNSMRDGVPEGWEHRTLGECLTLKRGHDLPEAKRIPGNIPIVSSSGVTGFHNLKKADGPGLITGRYGTLGEVYYVEYDYWPHNTALYVCDFKGNSARVLFFFLKHALQSAQSNNAAVPGLNRNVLHTLRVLWPPQNLRDHFDAFLQPLFRQLASLRRFNERLGAAHDMLLPRLMSGEVVV